MASASGGEEEGGVGFLEEVSVLAEGFFLLLAHAVGLSSVRLRAVEGVVVSLEVSGESHESLDDDALEFAAFLEGGAWGQAGSSDGAASAAAGGEDVLASGVDGGLG